MAHLEVEPLWLQIGYYSGEGLGRGGHKAVSSTASDVGSPLMMSHEARGESGRRIDS